MFSKNKKDDNFYGLDEYYEEQWSLYEAEGQTGREALGVSIKGRFLILKNDVGVILRYQKQ
jgi:hypothetical protein